MVDWNISWHVFLIHPLPVTVVTAVFYAHSKRLQRARKSYVRLPGSTSSAGAANSSVKFSETLSKLCLASSFTSANEKMFRAIGELNWFVVSNLYVGRGEIIGPESYKNEVYPRCFLNYWPKPKKLNTWPPKLQTRDIVEPFYGNGPTESPK